MSKAAGFVHPGEIATPGRVRSVPDGVAEFSAMAGHAGDDPGGLVDRGQSRRRRQWGFWSFLAGNALWLAWGLNDGAFALVGLQICLAALNIRGARKNNPDAGGR